MSDLRLGVRLAIGGGRTSKTGVARLVLSTIGIGLAVAVLLVGASAGPMFSARSERQYAQVESPERIPGVDPMYSRSASTAFRGRSINGTFLHATGPRSPLAPGLDRVPGDGEIVVSESLAELLAGPDAELLRPRFPQRIIGTIGREGVTDAGTLTFYAGDGTLDRSTAQAIYAYGARGTDPMPATLAVLIAIGTVVLLVPVFVFVATSARVAGAERDRRLAALRLVGAGARQARRIAAAESLAGAVTGLAFGIGLFLLFRSAVGNIELLGVNPYPGDVAPPWPLVLLIVLAVPALAMATAQIALRRTIIEPLGVVRRGRPVRRRLWWRLVPIVLGPVLLLSQGNVSRDFDSSVVAIVAGATLLLFGIPALLPWLLERAVARVHGGRPPFQLAVRRLQLDSGTPARVVGGVAVVLAGAIALQTVLAAQTAKYTRIALPDYLTADTVNSLAELQIEGDIADEVVARVSAVPGVASVVTSRSATAQTERGDAFTMSIVDCAALTKYLSIPRCTDGDVFRFSDRARFAGQTVTMIARDYAGDDLPTGDRWTLPAEIRRVDYAGGLANFAGELLATPGAVRGVRIPSPRAQAAVQLDLTRPDVLEGVRNAVAPFGWRVSVYTTSYQFLPDSLQLFLTIQGALLGGALFTLLLAGVSMLVLALEQMRERRRPLAALAATGVPTGTLARSLLWQNMIPVLVGVVVAVATGLGLAALVFQLIGDPFTVDWPTVGLYSGIAAVLVVLVTVLTLPTLRSATRLAALRSE
ncbi:MAG TPA: FtsX-like permease family protein [Actinophytocola sp.]|uniref:FtsX-like permease family protein n=1 Tax=Actinophytocola sp. TaxID=1872138 RepID=UPI002E03ABE9|nr:FtsX-like permease family protein [Actinophytocola sp.]